MLLVGAGGVGVFFLSLWLDARPLQLYAVYDYWHTSPNFFLARVGILMVVACAAYAWCRWGLGQIGFSPLVQLGQTSLPVYWVHIEFVYGRFSILPKRAQTIPMASLGLLVIFSAMVLLSLARTRFRGRGAEIRARIRRVVRPAAEG
jgi:fucose 4-O-acetylase-like acetyltransferase